MSSTSKAPSIYEQCIYNIYNISCHYHAHLKSIPGSLKAAKLHVTLSHPVNVLPVTMKTASCRLCISLDLGMDQNQQKQKREEEKTTKILWP